MSKEMASRSRCDICKRLLDNEYFFCCQKSWAPKQSEFNKVSWIQTMGDRIPSYNDVYTDVCMDCWKKLSTDYILFLPGRPLRLFVPKGGGGGFRK